jgi:hypothetical protein
LTLGKLNWVGCFAVLGAGMMLTEKTVESLTDGRMLYASMYLLGLGGICLGLVRARRRSVSK